IGPAAEAAVPHLLPLLGDTEEYVRGSAAKALGQIGPAAEAAVPHLLPLLGDTEVDVRSRAAEALGQIGPQVDQIAGLANVLKGKSREARRVARKVLRSWSGQLRCIIFPDGTWQKWQGP